MIYLPNMLDMIMLIHTDPISYYIENTNIDLISTIPWKIIFSKNHKIAVGAMLRTSGSFSLLYRLSKEVNLQF